MNERINYYTEMFAVLADPMEIYGWLIDLGKKLQQDPLSPAARGERQRVSRCQFALYVDYEEGRFKAYSDALIASGYAYLLLDIFNHMSWQEAAQCTHDDFAVLRIEELLSFNRTNGFYQMIDMLIAMAARQCADVSK